MAYTRSRRPASTPKSNVRPQPALPLLKPSQLLGCVERIGSAVAYAGKDGGGLTADACEALARDLRTVYRGLLALDRKAA